MGYQALLFCPDDKTARTVTQVLSELEFNVEACIEPFAAVKKLMGQHFDAVVVDCDNEQNATLLFKSARNSTSNQTSLAVAVVEGQAGVAKAFRIGANLVLTKPINIEQAKGTLRVARGLLRKSDPSKPGSATATASFAVPTPPPAAPTPAPTTTKSAVPRPPLGTPVAARPVVPTATTASRPQPPVQKPVAPAPPAAWPAAAATAQSAPAAGDDIPAVPAAEKPPAPAAPPALYSAAVATPAAPRVAPSAPPTIEFKSPVLTAHNAPMTSGAASAPAPAREPVPTKIEHKSAPAAEDLFEKPAVAAASQPSAYVGSAPSFTFGAATAEGDSGGGSKKVMIGIAAALFIVAGSYFGWSHFKGTSSSTPQPVTASTTVSAPVSIPAAPKPTAAQPAPATMAAATPATKPTNISSALAKSVVEDKSDVAEKTEAPALIVKGGKAPTVGAKPAATPDAPAPSVIGMGAPTAAPLPNLGTTDTEFRPVLQTLSVSQGVSQGLLYKKVAPSYPQNALRMHIEGKVELLATISKEGNITHIKVLSGDAQLARAANDAVKQWKYKPYLLNGEPVEIQTQVTVNFKLPR
jgi:protein TonB